MNLGMKIGSQSSNSDRGSNVTQSIPQFSGAIDDITLVQGVAAFISVAPFFSGGGLSFALAANSQPLPAGMSLSPQGVLQGVTSDLIEDQDIIFEVTNEEGAVQGSCLLSTIPREISVGLTGAVENQTHGLSAQSGVGLQAGIDKPIGRLPRSAISGILLRRARFLGRLRRALHHRMQIWMRARFSVRSLRSLMVRCPPKS